MVSKRKKKYTTGEGNQFYTRKAALKKLQVSLNEFRRLCILKGIYPREPINRKRAQKATPGIKTLYHKKDIRFLMHDPIMWKIRDYKIFHRKVGRAKAVRDFETMNRYLKNHPQMKIDHIVKQRYPTFIDALRDLDDCLTLCYLFSTFPSLEHIAREQFTLCRRLTVEFLHAVIQAKALRKVFVSIKGYYYQAEIKGQTITWIVPHHFQFQPQSRSDVDFKLMSIFVEFYTVMLGFVNFRLYHSLNLIYPPKFSGLTGPTDYEKCLVDEESYVSERIASLNFPISSTGDNQEEEVEIDTFETDDDQLKLEEKRKEAEQIKKLKTLFKGLKFFLNREVPREPLVFIIRCFGGEVSWDSTVFLGSTFGESDQTITHQIVDRPGMKKQYISRYYVQPQWVFDSVNFTELLPVEKYFLGVVLPPHLSPFIDPTKDQQYVPPEEEALRNHLLLEQKDEDNSDAEEDEEENKEMSNDDDEDNIEDENGDDNETNEESSKDDAEENNENDDSEDEEARKVKKAKKAKMCVTPGQVYKEVPWEEARQDKQAFRLREKMVKKKYKNLYRSMKAGQYKRAQEVRLLKRKRRIIDKEATEKRKMKKKSQRSS